MLILHADKTKKIQIQTSDGAIEFYTYRSKDSGRKYAISAPKKCKINNIPKTAEDLAKIKNG